MPETVGYILMFTAVGIAFVLVNLCVGSLLRPAKMDKEKGTIYECGEPAVGSAWVQFDLRFYVVALLFVIFDVEMAFFFPWAVVFGKANQLSNPNLPVEVRVATSESLLVGQSEFDNPKAGRQNLLAHNEIVIAKDVENASNLAWVAFADIGFFFGVLLVGFAYLWQRGDLNWVRSLAAQKEG
jgi:NADH-quinone oxidoreductase subunit A